MGKPMIRLSGVSVRVFVVGAVVCLSACAPAPPVTSAFDDPYERQNRAVHELNKGIDRTLVRPLTQIAGDGDGDGGFTRPLRKAAINLGDTLEGPGRVVNNVLQGRFEDAGHNAFRLAANVVFGLGVLDPATDMGLPARDTDFGETLHAWGASEGAYLEIPVLGPSTERDFIGDLVDSALNPLSHVLPKGQRAQARGVRIAAQLAERSRFGSTIDDVLYSSADSYAQLRLIYLQNRRFELARNARRAGQDQTAQAYADPYEDPYGEGLAPDPYESNPDPTYIDPYEELYGP